MNHIKISNHKFIIHPFPRKTLRFSLQQFTAKCIACDEVLAHETCAFKGVISLHLRLHKEPHKFEPLSQLCLNCGFPRCEIEDTNIECLWLYIGRYFDY